MWMPNKKFVSTVLSHFLIGKPNKLFVAVIGTFSPPNGHYNAATLSVICEQVWFMAQ